MVKLESVSRTVCSRTWLVQSWWVGGTVFGGAMARSGTYGMIKLLLFFFKTLVSALTEPACKHKCSLPK